MEFRSKFGQWIAEVTLRKTPLVVMLLLTTLIGLGSQLTNFRLDASADSLLLENDPSLTAYRQTYLEYGSDDYLFLLFEPQDELFTQNNLDELAKLQEQIVELEQVSSVTSILDIPLFDPNETDIFTVEGKSTTLRAGDFDLTEAKAILVNNPIYRNLIISEKGSLTALQINLDTPDSLRNAIRTMTEFQVKHANTVLNESLLLEQQRLRAQVKQENQIFAAKTESTIKQLRKIIAQGPENVRLFLGGVPMIANDLMNYVQSDLTVFGSLIVVVLLLILTLIFRKLLWILLPLTICVFSVVAMTGLLGLLDWPATVISSNFIALLLIMTMSLVIHLIVRFRELSLQTPEQPLAQRITDTLSSMFVPCLFTALTTMVAFGSLVVSDIRPVKDFGIMMSIGLALAFSIAFISFPILVKLTYRKGNEKQLASRLTEFTSALGRWTLGNSRLIFSISIIIGVFAVSGLFKLTVDNRFIDYFRSHTEIHQGMKTIDEQLGGTTPIDIVINTEKLIPQPEPDEFSEGFDEFDDNNEKVPTAFTQNGAAKLAQIQSYLEQYDVTGKVLSLTSSFRLLNSLNGGKPLDDFLLGLFYKRMSPDISRQLISPYINDDGTQVHYSIRMIDSHPQLKRDEFIESLHEYFQNDLNLTSEDYAITGMFVLYNNMLSSLFDSQIKTIATVFLAILTMFIFIFRSVALAILGLIPNALAAAMVLGAMGWFGIPLDMMTIMIAAIAIGIGVDNTIHYIFRFRREFSSRANYEACVQACHDSIGKALYYTSLTVIAGFSILVFSNFIPTIYFGLLTSVAMGTALLANLTLLPRLLLLFKPKIPAV
ncbi:efflux RND transporter permease subunit [Pleionea litopenaei]|uniref:MMPL family transporter n=1 Tax=Pleionea litopenaei TaxID=3070815 RepID=A0AA51X6K3_9GAMM|nr:MMPL family transporter [Pleionea sp. HL-JVS1]WMS87218.1 MMPL family transporter [Pleionea sp. HL-JVS1]